MRYIKLIFLLMFVLVLGGCTRNTELGKLEKNIGNIEDGLNQDATVNDILNEDINISEDLGTVESVFKETQDSEVTDKNSEEIISDEELNQFSLDIESNEDTTDFDLEELDLNINLN